MARLLERIDAGLNPLMIKEAHQSLRSRPLVIGGLLALLVPLGVYLINIASREPAFEDERAGVGFFWLLAAVLGLIGCGLVPVRAAQQLHMEIRTKTLELIVLSGLTPWQLAVGRFQAAGLQIVLLVGMLLPFAIASVTLGGIGLGRVVVTLLMIVLLGLWQVALGLLATSLQLLSPRLGALGLGAFGLQLLMSIGTTVGVLSDLPARSSNDVVLYFVAFIAVCTLLWLRLTADILTPNAARSSVLAKLIALALLGIFCAPLGPWMSGTKNADDQAALLLTGLLGLHFLAMIWSAADTRPNPKLGPLRGVLGDGCEPTLVYSATVCLALAAIARLSGGPAFVPLLIGGYFLFFTGLAVLLRHALRGGPDLQIAFFALCIVCDLVAGLFYLAVVQTRHLKPLTPLAVLLPMSWDRKELMQAGAWFVLPPAIGLCALVLARRVRASRPDG